MASRERALIVGAGAGLSAALARRCAGDGMDVVLAARDTQKLGALASETAAATIACDATRTEDVERLFPARRYVMVDDKLRILSAIKAAWGERVTTVFARQGHYANDPQNAANWCQRA